MRGLNVLVFFMWVFLNVFFRVALHKGTAHRPPRKTKQRDPFELFFDKKFYDRNFVIKNILQNYRMNIIKN